MSQGFGLEVPSRHAPHEPRQVSRYLVVIASGDVQIARLFLASREQVAEIDAGTEEAAQMTANASASVGASGPEWDRALAGHSADERAGATVYLLDV